MLQKYKYPEDVCMSMCSCCALESVVYCVASMYLSLIRSYIELQTHHKPPIIKFFINFSKFGQKLKVKCLKF